MPRAARVAHSLPLVRAVRFEMASNLSNAFVVESRCANANQNPHRFSAIVIILGIVGGASGSIQSPQAARIRWLIAHRGASAYAPENTVPALRLAAEQGATFVEFDLQLTKDRQIVLLHDTSLERTTDVEEVFPDRFRRPVRARRPRGGG